MDKWTYNRRIQTFKLSGIIPLLPITSAYSEQIAINFKKIVDRFYIKKLT